MTVATYPLEFRRWQTPFENDDVLIIGVQYFGELSAIYVQEGVEYELEDANDWDGRSLEIKLFCKTDESIYGVYFSSVMAFRVLDEHGLTELWDAGKKRPAKTTFEVRGHGWSKESPITFMNNDGWSCVIATDWDCVEIVPNSDPEIKRERNARKKQRVG
ncbi:hypothetical protein [Hyphococcus sp.]|uniref:hypothetical protein n=1 Tax=Hyphococcus sp. TaxID=2038636 RepID=UPI003CCBACA5